VIKYRINILVVSLISIFIFAAVAFADGAIQSADPDRIAQDVNLLASDDLEGRMTGTHGAEVAADHVKSCFESVGLQPGDALDGDYFQDFDITSGVSPGNGNTFIIRTPDSDNEGTLNVDFQPYYFSKSGNVSGEVVFAGYGITADEYGWDDYKDLDFNGKIVFCLLDEPGRDDPDSVFDGKNPTEHSALRWKVMNAIVHGATALILARGPSYIAAGDSGTFIGFDNPRGLGERTIPVVQVSQDFAELLFSTMDAPLEMYQGEMENRKMAFGAPLENISVEINVDLVRDYIKTWNVVGILPGSDPVLSDQYVIIGAHYDHIGYGLDAISGNPTAEIHNGADDNASGVAGLMELARLFASCETAPRRSILFISFSGEEIGALGSSFYVSNPIVPLDKTTAMINMDMIGRVTADEEGNDFFAVHGLASADEWKEIVPDTSPDGTVDIHKVDAMIVGSDFTNFYEAQIPILNFFSGIHEDYHKPTDDADKINFDGLAEIVNTVYEVVIDIANRDEMLTFESWDVPAGAVGRDPATAPTRQVYLGTMPDFEKMEGGYWLAGVMPGSPAEAAGMLAGDCMIKLGDYEITDVYAYTDALAKYSPGDTVEVIVLRDGVELTLSVTFGERSQ